jgi:uncharacterized protein (DUF2267 family)
MLLGGAGLAGLVLVARHHHALQVHWHRLRRTVRHEAGSWRGAAYRWAGRHPSDDVDDPTLGDRVRSTIGPLEKALDLPHVHVMVEKGVVLLHGEVSTDDERQALERAVSSIAGVQGVESYLHLGLLPGDTRPSAGRLAPRPPSSARVDLLNAARRAGVDDPHAAEAVRATISVFAQRLPTSEREHMLGHLPDDVRDLAAPARRLGHSIAHLHTMNELVLAVLGQDVYLSTGHADEIVTAIIGELRAHVPDDAARIAAVLPRELRAVWEHQAKGGA